MPTYTDDETNNARASDQTWGGLSDAVEDAAKLAGTFLFGLLVTHDGGTATATDGIVDSVYLLTTETATASNTVPQQLTATNTFKSTAKARDTVTQALLVTHEETATATDVMTVNTGFHTVAETARATDTVTSRREVTDTLAETATATDVAYQAGKASLVETAIATDTVLAAQGTADTLDETASAAADQVSGVLRAHLRGRETAVGADSVTQQVGATESVQDWIEGWDRVPQAGTGVAWVANTRNWAMSRYAAFDVTSMTVIDGVLYATTADGVYALNGCDETLTAALTTAPMDVGQGGLAHLAEAYLAYSLEGSASLTVTQTQGGSAESYTYDLPAKGADTLTTGRIPLGRGLRGRHFTFSLRLTGTAAHLDDLRITTMPVKRRV